MRGILVLAVIILIGVYVLYIRNGAPVSLLAYRSVSEEHYNRVITALQRFHEERLGRGDIHALSAHKATVIQHLNELKFRIPNDAEAQDNLERTIEDMTKSLENDMQRIRKSTETPLRFPYPMDGYFMDLEPYVITV